MALYLKVVAVAGVYALGAWTAVHLSRYASRQSADRSLFV